MDFTVDHNLAKVTEANSADCVDFLARHLSKHLDYSAASVVVVEQCLGVFHDQKAAGPGEEQIQQFAKMFGSYLGETYRRLHGGQWGVDGARQPAFRTVGGGICWPWTRAYKRIMNGPEDDVVHWFHYLVENGGESPPQTTPVPPPLPGRRPAAPPPPKISPSKHIFHRLFGR
jgi:hypothetical protein